MLMCSVAYLLSDYTKPRYRGFYYVDPKMIRYAVVFATAGRETHLK